MSGGEGNIQYNWIGGVESLEKYQPGGYHPIMIGDLLHGRYQIVDKLDVHLRNILVKLPSSFDQLSEPLPPNVPAKTVIPLSLGKDAEEFSLSDTEVLLSDFGEAFSLSSDLRLGKDCRTPLPMRPPEARFEPETRLSFRADIWSLAIAIWELVGMSALFSTEFAFPDELISQHIDVLGPMPSTWWERWEKRSQFFDPDGRPSEGRDVWPPLDKAFEEDVQKYRRKHGRGEFDRHERAAILDLMRRMLAFRPEERPTAEEVLRSE
ncbi:hypothetical protein VTO42DRAFT_2523 [Malbranchea cinnamomea]